MSKNKSMRLFEVCGLVHVVNAARDYTHAFGEGRIALRLVLHLERGFDGQ
jgi:hypothetical protein